MEIHDLTQRTVPGDTKVSPRREWIMAKIDCRMVTLHWSLELTVPNILRSRLPQIISVSSVATTDATGASAGV